MAFSETMQARAAKVESIFLKTIDIPHFQKVHSNWENTLRKLWRNQNISLGSESRGSFCLAWRHG